jgi:hypothetical protein
MAIVYRIYANDGLGGPINYNLPIATTAATTYLVGTLPPGSDAAYAVRAFDDSLGIEESNRDARVRVRTDAQGNDVGALPCALIGPSVRRISGRRLALAWLSPVIRGSAGPDGFRLYATTVAGGVPDQLLATVAFVSGQSTYRLIVADAGYRGLTIRPYNAAGERTAEPVLSPAGLSSTASLSAAELIGANSN